MFPKKRLNLILLLTGCFLLGHPMVMAGELTILKKTKGETPQIISWPTDSEWVWKKSKKSKAMMFFNKSNITPPSDMGPLKVKAKSGRAKYSKAKGQIVLLTRSARNLLLIKGSQGVGRYQLKDESKGVISKQGCDSTTIELVAKGEEIPLPIGIHCSVEDTKTFLTIALPKDGEWVNSTLFEVDGKGESWKLYEIASAQARSGAKIGEFQFLFEDKTYDYSLRSSFIAQEESAQSLENNRYYVIAGTNDLKVSSGGSSASQSSYVFGGRILTRPLVAGFRVGFDVNIGQSFEDSSESISYKEFRGFASYRILDGSFKLAPRLYAVFSDSSSSSTGLNMVHQQFGGGLAVILALGESMELQASYLASGFLADEDVTHSSIQASLDFKTGKLSYGLGYELNAYDFKLEDGSTPKFEQGLITFRVGF